MAIEPPLKKRKHYEGDAGSKADDAAAAAPVKPEKAKVAPISEEVKLRKKMNRDEIGAFYKIYRRLKFCLDRKSASGPCAPDLEEAYCSMLNLSTGGSSVQRIAAEIIPRYAVYCPSSIDLASNVLIQILEWSEDGVFQEDDFDGVAFDTAKACLSGMVDLSAAAVKAAVEFPEISDMSTAVCQNIAFYMLCRLEDQVLPQFSLKEYADKITTCLESSIPIQQKLLDLVWINLVRLFHTHPKSIFAACFDLLGPNNENQRKKGLHFLAQIVKKEQNQDEVDSCAAGNINGNKDENLQDDNGSLLSDKITLVENLSKQVVFGNLELERWLVAAFRKFCNSTDSEILAESRPLLTLVLQSMSSFKESDLDPLYVEEPEPPEKQTIEEEPGTLEIEAPDKDSPKSASVLSLASAGAGEVVPSSPHGDEDMGVAHERSPKSADFEDADKPWDIHDDKPRGELSLDIDGVISNRQCQNAEVDSDKLAKHILDTETTAQDVVYGQSSSSTSLLKARLPPLYTAASSICRPLEPEDYRQAINFDDDAKAETRLFSSSGFGSDFSSFGPGYFLSPKSYTSLRPQEQSFTQRQSTWYSDGDPAALDVFAASKQLWVGALGHGVTENLLRYEFEKFGPLNSLSLFSGQDFGLVEYKSLNDAVRAREVLQGATPWLTPLKIKFLDVGLGSRGTIGGVAVGGSCHVYVGGVTSLGAKEEILRDMAHSCGKVPRSVNVLPTAGALLLEFDAPEEAAAVMLHVRKRRRESGFLSTQMRYMERASSTQSDEGLNSSGCQLWIGHLDQLVSDHELLSAFLEYGELIGWKFFRQSACCIVDFRSSDAAARAKSNLHGARFGNQYIQVEHRNNKKGGTLGTLAGSLSFNSQSNLANPRLQPPVLGGSSIGRTLQSPRASNQLSFQTRNASLRGGRESDRLPTNTLWVGFPDHTVQTLPSDTELKTIFNLACKGYGFVTKMSSIRSSRGPCRFVEFDSIEAASAALQNCAGYLDSGTQIEFSNPSHSLQQSDYPNTIVTPLNEDLRALWDKDHHWDRSLQTSSSLIEHDDSKLSTLHGKILPVGLGQTLFGGISDQSKYRFERNTSGHYESSMDARDEALKPESVFGKYMSTGNFRATTGFTGTSLPDSQGVPHGGSHGWIGSTRGPDRQTSVGGSLDSSISQHPLFSSLSSLKNPQGSHLDRISSTGSWSSQSLLSSSSLDPGGSISLPSAGSMAPNLQSALPRFAGSVSQSFEQRNSVYPPLPSSSPPPPPPLETPPPRPLSPPPGPLYHLLSGAPLPPFSPPSLASKPVKADSLSNSKQQFWRGLLCKSGFQYCEVLAYHQKSGMCLNNTFLEPAEWPNKLDVTKRADFRSVKYSFQNTPRDQRQVCRLCASQGSSNLQGFQQFESYLRQRDRAGVVMIPETAKIWGRRLFILPWSREICELLIISNQPTEGLVGLLLPMDTSFS